MTQSSLSRLAHDLRTPVGALKVATELLACRPALSEAQWAALVSSIQQSVRRLEALAAELERVDQTGMCHARADR